MFSSHQELKHAVWRDRFALALFAILVVGAVVLLSWLVSLDVPPQMYW